MTFFGTLKDLVTPELRLKTAQYLGENPDKTQKALDGLFSTIAGGLMKRAATEPGLDHLYRTLHKTEAEKNLLANLREVLDSSDRTGQLMARGNSLMSQLLPDKKSSIATMISSYAKVRNSSATSLMGLTMPLVLAVLRREVVDRNLDMQNLGSLLADQRESWLESIPDGLGDKLFEVLGIDNWQDMDAALRSSGAAAQRRSSAAAAAPRIPSAKANVAVPVTEELAEEEASSTWKRWLWPTVAVIGLGGIIFWYLNRPQSTGDETDPSAMEQAAPVSDTLARADSATRRTPLLGDSLQSKAGSAPTSTVAFVSQLTNYLKDPIAAPGRTFTLDGVKFVKSTHQLKAESGQPLGELATLMKTNPRLQIKLVGYATDADSLSNKMLSIKRAAAVKSRLVGAGVNLIRIDAVGLGSLGNSNGVDLKVVKR